MRVYRSNKLMRERAKNYPLYFHAPNRHFMALQSRAHLINNLILILSTLNIQGCGRGQHGAPQVCGGALSLRRGLPLGPRPPRRPPPQQRPHRRHPEPAVGHKGLNSIALLNVLLSLWGIPTSHRIGNVNKEL